MVSETSAWMDKVSVALDEIQKAAKTLTLEEELLIVMGHGKEIDCNEGLR